MDVHLLDAEAPPERLQRPHDHVGLVEAEVDALPDVDHDPVPEQPAVLGPLRLGPAQAVDARRVHVLQHGQAGETVVVVADEREVPHLGGGDDPLVAGVVAGDGSEEVRVAHRRQPLHLEAVPQPPQPEADGDHGVQAPDGPVLDPPARATAPVRDVARLTVGGLGRHRDAVDAVRQVDLAEGDVEAVREHLRVRALRVERGVDVDDDPPAGGQRRRLDGDGAQRLPQLTRPGQRRHRVQRLVLAWSPVAGDEHWPGAVGQHPQVLDLPDLVVPHRERLEQGLERATSARSS